MDMFDGRGRPNTGDDMARSSRSLDTELIESFVDRLSSSMKDADAFREAFADLANHPGLGAQDIIEIAHRVVGGMKPKSRKAALTDISQERLRLTQAKAKGQNAAKARTW